LNQVEEKIKALLDEKWLEPDFSDCFLVEIILKGNKLEVYLDSDTAITFEKCKKVSRVLEAYLDETKVLGAEYTLEVSSAGVGKPLLMPRQFEKNKSRELEIQKADGTNLNGILSDVTETHIVVTESVKLKEGKKQVKKDLTHEIPFREIKKAIVKIRF
jgi:ribosome maturation factor RimP